MGPTISTASFHVTTSLQFPFPPPPPRFRFLLAMSPDATSSDQRRAQSPKSPNSAATANSQPSLLVFSGGTAFNGVVEELKKFTTRVAHVLPVSDDGGSTAEIVRVLGGPAVGDIRSRCLRLSDESTAEALAVRTLLGHRLPVDADKAKSEWFEIVEGKHTLWTGVSKPYSETIRAFLVYFQNEILRRADDKNTFCFSNGSIGNFFFAGARIFFVSLDAAIFLFSRVSGIPAESEVLPVISTNERLTLACKLWNETIIRGQNEISHPSSGLMEPTKKDVSSSPALPARIKRVYYLSSEGTGQEVFPSPHPRVLERLMEVDCIVYSMGSLFTSICPSLVLRGIGEKIASRSCPKVLILNGSLDRETANFTASCFVTAITEALNRSYGKFGNIIGNSPQDYINTLLVPKGGQVEVDREQLDRQGIIEVITVDSVNDEKMGPVYDPKSIIEALAELLTE